MSLKGLIKDQTIIIDDHKRGIGEIKNWDNLAIDVHIDKTTNYPIEGKRQNVRIRIPINSNRPINIENNRHQSIDEIPSQLKREIKKAFENTEKRESFIAEVISVLKEFETTLSSEERVRQILSNLSKHFDLKWTSDKIATYSNNILKVYTEIYNDQTGNKYFMTVDKKKIKIGQINGFARHQTYITHI